MCGESGVPLCGLSTLDSLDDVVFLPTNFGKRDSEEFPDAPMGVRDRLCAPMERFCRRREENRIHIKTFRKTIFFFDELPRTPTLVVRHFRNLSSMLTTEEFAENQKFPK